METELKNIIERMKKQREAFETFCASQPQSVTCLTHGAVLAICPERTVMDSSGVFSCVAYEACPQCRQDAQETASREKLRASGVATKMLDCTLDNWIPRNPEEAVILAKARAFAEKRIGFLFLRGPVGTGKSHLAVAIMRTFRSGLFVTQSDLLLWKRASYDKLRRDPIDQCRDVGCLVLDEVGLSGGGKDEGQLIYDILDYREREKKATVITTNLTVEEMRITFGERLSDRLTESAFGVYELSGESHRREMRGKYFGN